MLKVGEFVDEDGLAGQSVRMASHSDYASYDTGDWAQGNGGVCSRRNTHFQITSFVICWNVIFGFNDIWIVSVRSA